MPHQLESSLQNPIKCRLKIFQKVSTLDQSQEALQEILIGHLLGDQIQVHHHNDLLHHHLKDNRPLQGENFHILFLPLQTLGLVDLFQAHPPQAQLKHLAPQY